MTLVNNKFLYEMKILYCDKKSGSY